MSDLRTRLDRLSPARRHLLQLELQRKGLTLPNLQCIPRRDGTKPCPASFGQQRLWFLAQLDPASPNYNAPKAIRLRGTLDVGAMRQALSAVVARHEVLRTTFQFVDGNLFQVVGDDRKLEFTIKDLRSGEEVESKAAIQCVLEEDARRPFDLTRDLTIRILLIRTAEDEHVMLLTLHHIASDAWSTEILLREIASFYEDFHEGKPSRLADLPIQYGDYAVWQREELENGSLGQHLTYWTKQLEHLAPVLELPWDRPRPGRPTGHGAKNGFRLPSRVVEGIHLLSRSEGVTVFMLLLGAFQTLLHRYTAEDDIVVGSPFTCRHRLETEGLIGFFVNTLPLQTDFAGDPSFRELLGKIRSVVLGAYEHQDLPFEKLVEQLQSARNPAYTPLFQTVFVMASARHEPKIAGLDVNLVDIDIGTSKFDLTLSIRESENGELVGSFEYNTDIFDSSTIERLRGHFEGLLEAVLSNPDLPVSELSFVTADESAQAVTEKSQVHTHDADYICIHQWFEHQAELTPDSIALVFESRELTYAELNRRANRLAHRLRTMGVGGDVLVALFLDRSIEMVVALLAVLKAGGAYLPIDIAYPAERVRLMLNDANPKVLITEETLEKRIPDHQIEMIVLGSDFQDFSAEESENLDVEISSANLAYVIYTSGSTGNPKGTLITHGNVVHLFKATERLFGIGSSDVWTLFHSIAFDFSVWEIWGALLYGGKLVIVPYIVSRAPDAFYELLAEQHVTVLNQTPSAFQQLIHSESDAGFKHNHSLSLRLVIFGGEALQPSMLRPWFEKHGDERPRIINMYGITETTVHVTYQPISLANCDAGSIIGVPLPGVRIYVLDRRLRRVPQGVAGEIYVAGAGLARGYLGRQELTAARFIANPFDNHLYPRLYKSGDSARLLPDGSLQYLGRLDDQVKIRGFRVELMEIETVLLEHSSVREAAVVFRDIAPGEKALVAYFTTLPELRPSNGELRTFMREKLPDYMVPAAFVLLDSFPVTANGKIDRKSLPAPSTARVLPVEAYVAARNPIEEILISIFKDVLHCDRINIGDNFFELGGHSLLATQVVSRIRSALDFELPLRKLFEAPTVAAISEFISSEEKIPGRVERIAVEKLIDNTAPAHEQFSSLSTTSNGYPLSFSQQRLWFLAQMEPGSSAYNVPAALRIQGPLDTSALGQALTRIVARHETLRSTFDFVDGSSVQVVHDAPKLDIPVTDLRSLQAERREQETRRLCEEEARRPFDLRTDLMIRTRLLRISDDEYVLLLTMHHIASDAWSISILYEEIAAFYGQYRGGAGAQISELPFQYRDYAVWQKRRLGDETIASHLSYWTKQLDHLPPLLQLPTDRPRPAAQGYRGGKHRFKLTREVSERLRALSLAHGVTLYMTLLAAFQILMHRYTGQDDIIIGSPIAGRDSIDAGGLIGFFVNTVVVRTDLSGDPSFHELLVKVREIALEAFAHQELPFEKLVEELQPDRNLGQNPLFQVLFAVQNAPTRDLSLPGLRVTPYPVDSKTAKFDLTLSISDRGIDELAGSFGYNTDLFDATTIERMCEHFQTLLESILDDPSRSINSLNLMTEAERHRILFDWNATQSPYPAEAGLHQLFVEQAERTPEAVALVFGSDRLTYRQLNEQANQLANCLRNSGIESNEIVAVCLDRSAAMIVAFLGILKAGGAYLPLDPSYPTARISFMVKDAGVRRLITETRMLDRFTRGTLKILCMDRDRKLIRAQSHENPESISSGMSNAYVIYTSGSTGKPKGVIIPHLAVTRLVLNTDYVALTPADVVAQVSNASFDAITFEVWGALLNGARLVGIPIDVLLSPKDFAASIQKQRISTLFLTTALFNRFARQMPSAFRTVRNLLFGGEVCEPESVKTILQNGSPARLVHMYGPTEATTFTSWHEVVRVEDGVARIPIGRPIKNSRIYILDKRLQPVPIGIPGELYIGGDGLARGYLNRPELTHERFVRDPLDQSGNSLLYRSSDLARFLPDGNIEWMGRLDQQIKLRGFRIEPGEIEESLKLHPGVRQAVVLAKETSSGVQHLVAYLVAGRQPRPSAEELRRWVAASLPKYMVPAHFVHLAEIPLTAGGKVDRQALAQLDVPTVTERAKTGPRDHLEAQLATIWERTLDARPASVHDNFFEVGGHSLLAVQLLAEIENATGKTVALAEFFRAPTIEDTARLLRKGNGPALKTRLVPLQPHGTKPPFFLLQGTLEIAKHMDPDQPFYTCLPHGEDGLPVPATVSEIAAEYIAEIRKVQPNGPYCFGGFSFTGLVALEMAQQLQQAGQRVAMLVLVDPTTTRSQGGRSRHTAGEPFSSYLQRHLKRLEPRPFQMMRYLSRGIHWRLAKKIRAVTTPVKWAACRALLPIWVRLPVKPYALRKFYFMQASSRLAKKYHPKLYDGDVVLIQSDQLSVHKDFWRGLVRGRFSFYQLPGDHMYLVREPNATALANILKSHFAEARAKDISQPLIGHSSGLR